MKDQEKQSTLREIKKELDELEEKLNLGNEELKATYEDHRNRFAALVQKVHDYVEEIEHSSSEKIQEFKKKSRYLLDTLESDFEISYTEYNEKPQDLKKALEEFEKSVKEYYKETSNEAKVLRSKLDEDLHQRIDKFRNELNFYQTRFEHSNKEKRQEFDQWKQNKLEDVQQLKQKVDAKLNTSKEKVGKFNNEISEAYQHLKSAFQKLK